MFRWNYELTPKREFMKELFKFHYVQMEHEEKIENFDEFIKV